jgi:hypothetical protein
VVSTELWRQQRARRREAQAVRAEERDAAPTVAAVDLEAVHD